MFFVVQMSKSEMYREESIGGLRTWPLLFSVPSFSGCLSGGMGTWVSF